MESKSAGIIIVTTLIFMYVLMSPFISNLEYKNLEIRGMACDASMTQACFLNVKALCFEYVSPCTVPDGWYIQKTASRVWYVEE